jgi:hypothetical protein
MLATSFADDEMKVLASRRVVREISALLLDALGACSGEADR